MKRALLFFAFIIFVLPLQISFAANPQHSPVPKKSFLKDNALWLAWGSFGAIVSLGTKFRKEHLEKQKVELPQQLDRLYDSIIRVTNGVMEDNGLARKIFGPKDSGILFLHADDGKMLSREGYKNLYLRIILLIKDDKKAELNAILCNQWFLAGKQQAEDFWSDTIAQRVRIICSEHKEMAKKYVDLDNTLQKVKTSILFDSRFYRSLVYGGLAIAGISAAVVVEKLVKRYTSQQKEKTETVKASQRA